MKNHKVRMKLSAKPVKCIVLEY